MDKKGIYNKFLMLPPVEKEKVEANYCTTSSNTKVDSIYRKDLVENEKFDPRKVKLETSKHSDSRFFSNSMFKKVTKPKAAPFKVVGEND
jgi:hypothetical protein